MAHGHAMINTATAAANARAIAPSPAASDHTTNVIAASTMTVGTKTALIRSARFWIGAREACASFINLTMCASTLSVPSVVAR
jgi:hypothetical protein